MAEERSLEFHAIQRFGGFLTNGHRWLLGLRHFGTCSETASRMDDDSCELDHTFHDPESVQLLFVLRIV
jgi:hypothetical protein